MFASCELSLDRLRDNVHEVLEVDGAGRWLNFHSVCPEPEIRVTLADLRKALGMRRHGELSEAQLIDWATTLLTNNVFYWDGADAQLIGEWINGISLDL